MALTEWQQHRFVVPHTTSSQEIADLLAITRRDLKEAASGTHCPEWQLAIAWNAALQAATAALAAAGYRATKGANHHHYTLQSLQLTVGLDSETLLMLVSRPVSAFPYAVRCGMLSHATTSDCSHGEY